MTGLDPVVTARRLHLLAGGYTPLPVAGKAVYRPEWKTIAVDKAEVMSWEAHPDWPGIGIRTGEIVGVDIDVDDAALAERVKALAMDILGKTTLVRVGRSPRMLLVYRTETPIRKKVATGVAGKVEALGDGQQFVAYGIHPDTQKPYTWIEADLLDVPATHVPPIGEKRLDAFLAAALDALGGPLKPKPSPAPSQAPYRANGHDTGTDTAEAIEALYAIPGSLEYDEWVRVGMAFYAALGPSGEAHWMAWSARSPKNQIAVTIGRWRSFHQVRDIRPETLFWFARENGWKPERESATVSDLGIFKAKPPPLPRHDPETGEILEEEQVAEPATSSATTPPLLAFTPYAWVEPGKIPPRRFVYGRHYIRQFLSTDISPGGIGKSSLAIADAVAMAAHKDLLGVLPTERIKVAYWNGEDPMEELQRRVQAVALHYGVEPDEIEGRLFVDSGRLLPLILAREGRNGVILDQAVISAIISSLKANAIDVLIVDPFIASHRVGENDNNAIELVAKAWSHIADVTNCAVNLVHHSRKLNGEEVTVESGRGASALLAACRSARTLNQMTKDEAAQLNVENHRLYFRVDDGKSNLQPPAEGAIWHQLVNVDLPNGPMGTVGDKVGVVTRWQKPDVVGGMSSRDLLAVQNAVAAGKWRDNSQARDWVGKAVAQALGYALPEEAGKVKMLVKTWLKSGALTTVSGLDEQRRQRDYIEVGDWVKPND